MAESFPCTLKLYVNALSTPSRHVELVQYAYSTALITTCRAPSLLVGYLEDYLGRLQVWLRNWRIVIKVSKSTFVPFAKATSLIRQPRPVQFLGLPIECVESALYLGMNLDTLLNGRHTSTS
jgi:hypothetical protein